MLPLQEYWKFLSLAVCAGLPYMHTYMYMCICVSKEYWWVLIGLSWRKTTKLTPHQHVHVYVYIYSSLLLPVLSIGCLSNPMRWYPVQAARVSLSGDPHVITARPINLSGLTVSEWGHIYMYIILLRVCPYRVYSNSTQDLRINRN